MVNLCRDEITDTLKHKIEHVFGSSFNTNGLGGVLTCGVTGVNAGLSHAPISRVRCLDKDAYTPVFEATYGLSPAHGSSLACMFQYCCVHATRVMDKQRRNGVGVRAGRDPQALLARSAFGGERGGRWARCVVVKARHAQ
jgi:hypothetical protein